MSTAAPEYSLEPLRRTGRIYLTTDSVFVVESEIALGPIDQRAGPGDHIVQMRLPPGQWEDLRPVEEGEKLIIHAGTQLRLQPVEAPAEIDYVSQGTVVQNGLRIGREVMQ